MAKTKVDLGQSLENLMDLMNQNIKALQKHSSWSNPNPKISDVLYTTNQMNHLKYMANKFPLTRQSSDQSSTTTSSSQDRLNLKNYNGVIIRENFKGSDYLSNGLINANPGNLKKKNGNKVTFSKDTNYYDVDMKTPRWDNYWWGAMGRCLKCNKTTTPLDAIRIGDRTWHSWCLKCEHCWMTLDNKSSVKLFQGNVFCPRCYTNLLTTLKVDPWRSPLFFSNPDFFNSIPTRNSWFGPKYFSDQFYLWNKMTGNHIYENHDIVWEHYYVNGYDKYGLLHQKRYASTLLYENLHDPFLPYLHPGYFSPHFGMNPPSRSVKPTTPALPPPPGWSGPTIPTSRGLPAPPLPGSRGLPPPPPPSSRHNRPMLPPSSYRPPPPIPNGHAPPPPPPTGPLARRTSNIGGPANDGNQSSEKPGVSFSGVVSTKKNLRRLSNGKFVMSKTNESENISNVVNKTNASKKAATTWRSQLGGASRAAEKLEDFGGPSAKHHTYVNQEMIWKNKRMTKSNNSNNNNAVKSSPFKNNLKRTDSSAVVNRPNFNKHNSNLNNNSNNNFNQPAPVQSNISPIKSMNSRKAPPPPPLNKRAPPPPPPTRQVPPPPMPQQSYKHYLMDHYRYEQLQYLDWIQSEEELNEYFNRYHTYANAEVFWKHTPSKLSTRVGPTNKQRQMNGGFMNGGVLPQQDQVIIREKPNMGRKILQQPVHNATESLAEMNDLKKRLMRPFSEKPEESDDDSAKSSPKIVELESDTSTEDMKAPRKTRKEPESNYQSVISSAQDAWMEEYGVPVNPENDKNKNWIENNKDSAFVDKGFAQPNYTENKNTIREESFSLRGTNSLKRTILRQTKKTAEENNKQLPPEDEKFLEHRNRINQELKQGNLRNSLKKKKEQTKNENSAKDSTDSSLTDFENDQKKVFEKLDNMLKDESRKMGEQFYTELHNNNNNMTSQPEPVKAKLPFRNIKKERSLTEINVSKDRIPEEKEESKLEGKIHNNNESTEISPRRPSPESRVLHCANTDTVARMIEKGNRKYGDSLDTLSEQGTYKGSKRVSFASPNVNRANTVANIQITNLENEETDITPKRREPLGESATSLKNIPKINTSQNDSDNLQNNIYTQIADKKDLNVKDLYNITLFNWQTLIGNINQNNFQPESTSTPTNEGPPINRLSRTNIAQSQRSLSPVNTQSPSRSTSPIPKHMQPASQSGSPAHGRLQSPTLSASPLQRRMSSLPRDGLTSHLQSPSHSNSFQSDISTNSLPLSLHSGSPAHQQINSLPRNQLNASITPKTLQTPDNAFDLSRSASPIQNNPKSLPGTSENMNQNNANKNVVVTDHDDPSDNIDVGFLDIQTDENNFYNEIQKEGILRERQGGILPPHRDSLGTELDSYSSLMASKASSRYSPLITSTSKIISSISPSSSSHFTNDLVLVRKDNLLEEKSSTLKNRREDDAHLARSFGDTHVVQADENNNDDKNNSEKKPLFKKIKFWKK